jgi:endonuclease/exonuclease/phosphatase family metal-dependent hydrolase
MTVGPRCRAVNVALVVALIAGCGDASSTTDPDAAAKDDSEPADAPADATPDTGASSRLFRVWHWNIAGNTMHQGSTTDGLIDVMADSIMLNNADVVSVNEICQTQYDALLAALQSRGWPIDPMNCSRFAVARMAGTGVCQQTAYGIALFSKAPLGTADVVALTDANASERRQLLCAPLVDRPHTWLCTTHLTNDAAYTASQVQEVRMKLATYLSVGGTVIVAGDLNLEPNNAALDSVYSSNVQTSVNGNNGGAYRELDDADSSNCLGYGEQTFGGVGVCGIGKKIDYVFVSEAALAGGYELDSHAVPSCGTSACSDHRMIEGTVTLLAP